MPSTSSVGKYGVQEAEISVNLVSVDQNMNSLAVEGWKETYLNKIGSLYKVPDWQEAEIEITVTIPLQVKPDTVVVHLNCDVTNYYQLINCKKVSEETIGGKKYLIFNSVFNLTRNNISGILSLYADALKNENLVAESSYFRIWSDKRVPPNLGSSLFDWKFRNFEDNSLNKEPISSELNALIKNFKGKNFYSLITPPENDELTTIYVNTNFHEILETIFDENINENLEAVRDLLFLYFASNAFMYEFSTVTLRLSNFKSELRQNLVSDQIDEENLREMIYSDIKTEFAEESDDINFKKIDGLSLYLYPELKSNQKERIFKFWKSSNQQDSKDLFVRFNLAFQSTFNPSRTLKGFEKLIEIIENSVDEGENNDF